MIPAIDPEADYRALVRRSYDACAEVYEESRRTEPGIEIQSLVNRLEDGAAVLDIGCGSGVPIAKALAERYRVTGVDVSQEMVRRARENVPSGEFICNDVMSVDFEPSSFDAVVAFYSVFHLPRAEHPSLFRRIHDWLRPGGYLLCTLSHGSEAGYTEPDFHGVTMYWSNFGLGEYLEILPAAGFEVLEVSSTGAGWRDPVLAESEDHPLVLASPACFARVPFASRRGGY